MSQANIVKINFLFQTNLFIQSKDEDILEIFIFSVLNSQSKALLEKRLSYHLISKEMTEQKVLRQLSVSYPQATEPCCQLYIIHFEFYYSTLLVQQTTKIHSNESYHKNNISQSVKILLSAGISVKSPSLEKKKQSNYFNIFLDENSEVDNLPSFRVTN